jgi:hypothetical protein
MRNFAVGVLVGGIVAGGAVWAYTAHRRSASGPVARVVAAIVTLWVLLAGVRVIAPTSGKRV